MKICRTPVAMTAWSVEGRQRGNVIALVPTMGALHSGHQALIERATETADLVVVSIFVNPLQFNQPTDFETYPTPIEEDLARCERAGVHAVFAPSKTDMYPDGFQTYVDPGELADRLEGPNRPGHFRGVTTAVTKLFGSVQPDLAFFGQKDFQQLAIIRRMVDDLNSAVRVVSVPTVRDTDGLALSSRNTLLRPEDRACATVIYEALRAAKTRFDDGEQSVANLIEVVHATLNAQSRAKTEYVALVDGRTLDPIEIVESTSVLLVAAWFGEVRLIDNIVFGDDNLGDGQQ